MNRPGFSSVICPLFKLGNNFDVYCEVNPSYTTNFNGDMVGGWYRQQGVSLDVVPGFGINFYPIMFSVAVPFYDVNNNLTPSIGMWAFFAIIPRYY